MNVGRWQVLIIVPLLLSGAAAQDTVYLSTSGGGQTKVTGRVIDYTGQQLQIELPGGRPQQFPAARVLKVDTQQGPLQTQADDALRQGRLEEALAGYRRAMSQDSRPWVQRQIMARAVWCYRGLGQDERAGEAFLSLLRSDPHTLYFDCMPLAWLPRQPSVPLEQSAKQWLQRQEPAAVLLGASHLLTTAARATALERLKQLAAGDDRRTAALARAQAWRAAVATADPSQLEAWARTIETFDFPLRAGPYFVLGSARLQRQQWERAAIDLLRVPILYPQDRLLAAQAALDAGRALEQLDQRTEAARLYRELIGTYPEQARIATEAKSRLEQLQAK